MEDRNSGIVWGILLIALGGFLLATRLMPECSEQNSGRSSSSV